MNITKPTFNGREEYVVWRKIWREEYKALSLQISAIKWARHQSPERIARAEAANDRQEVVAAVRARVAHIRNTAPVTRYGSLDGALWVLRGEAHEMMELRKASKVEAQRQYQERKAQAAAA